jgi:hypothetical protein
METGKKQAKKSSAILLQIILIIGSICGTAMAATPTEIEQAIEDGVAWLAAEQNSTYGYWQGGGYAAASTGLALIKLQERAFELGYTPFDPCYPYEPNVEKGLSYLFSQISVISISTQPHGNPDTDGDGNGVFVNSGDGYITYDTGIAMMAIAAGRAPNRIVNSPGSPVNGWTYKDVLQDMVDYMAWSQVDDGGERGAWKYSHNAGWADNSNSGYAVSGLGFAESPHYGFNCNVPQFVKDELKIWIDFIQTDGGPDDGGSGYTSPGSMVNILKTGNLIFQMTFAGISSQDPNFQRALAYIGRKWNDPFQDPGWGNTAYGGTPNYQAMYCTANGLKYGSIKTIMVDGDKRDWYADFADAIVNTQDPCGYWSTNPYGGAELATEWALLTLEMTTSGPIPPCHVILEKVDDINHGNCVGPGDEINYRIDYNYPAGPNCPDINDVNIIDYLPGEVEFISADSNGTYERCSNTVRWYLGTLSPGESGFVMLKVKVKCATPGGTITNYCEIRSSNIIYSDWTYESTPVYGPTFTKEDNVPDGKCIGPGDNITYNIYYNANGYRDTNVVIIDELPDEVNYVSSDPCGIYNPGNNTIKWDIGTLEPTESDCVTLTVKVKSLRPGGVITNLSEMRGDCMDITACEDTPVCRPTLTKVDNITGCVGLGSNIIYDINYAANGYEDTNVIIIDELPDEVNYISSSDPCGVYHPGSRTVTWDIDTLEPNELGSVTLTVKVNYLGPGSTIRNKCEIRSNEQILRSAYEYTPKCGCSADPCIIKLDFNYTHDNNDANTQLGFTRFILENSGSEVNGVVIDLGGNIQSARRNGPYGDWAGGVYYPRAGERIYRDFIYGLWPSGVTITLWGLGANREYDISIYSFDDQSTPRRLADWTANGNYLLTTDFNGGMINWPDDETVRPQDLYKYAFTGTATTDYFGRVILESTAYPSCGAAGKPFAFVNGLTVVPIGTFIPTKYAQRPVPFDGTQIVPVNTLLKWRNGQPVVKHDLYLGTDWDDVNDSRRDSHPGVLAALDLTADANKGYDPYGATGFLKLDTTYYWRVDENSPPIYKGEVWSFKTLQCSVVDDFDRYEWLGNDILRAVWKGYDPLHDPNNCATVFTEQATHNGRSGSSMKYTYENHAYFPYYSEANATIGTGEHDLKIDPNWFAMDAKALSIWFYGDSGNPISEHDEMYIKLVDSETPAHTAKVMYDGNISDLREQWWHEWNIALTYFTGVNLRKVKNIIIGFGDGTQSVSDGNMYFDDIRLYTTRCILSKRSADFALVDYAPPGSPAGDCVINYHELNMMVDDWLMEPPVEANVDLYYDDDCTINFKDFALIAKRWLEEDMFP